MVLEMQVKGTHLVMVLLAEFRKRKHVSSGLSYKATKY